MYPVLFRVGSFAVRSYDALVVLGMLAGLSLCYWRARRAGLGGGRVVAGVRATEVVSVATILVAGVVLGWRWTRARSSAGEGEYA